MIVVIAGIDPGLTGGAAVIQNRERTISSKSRPRANNYVETTMLPTAEGVRGREIDTFTLARWLGDRDVTDCAVEMAQAMPQEASSRAFKYGMGYGAILGLLRSMGINHHPVHPLIWKRHHNLLKQEKVLALDRAIELWPSCADQFKLKKYIHRAEAALMAAWYIDRRD